MEKRGPRVLLVDEEESSLQTLSLVLSSAGYAIYAVRTGKEALQKVQSIRPDLILLDFGLADVNAKQVIERLREWVIAPIIVMSACDEESEKVSSLDMGAHDYITKPFSVPELLARMRATLRSVSLTQTDVFTVNDLKVDLGRREVSVGETPVRLTATEYDLLKILIRHADSVRTHHQLIHELWGRTQYMDAVHLLRVTLSHLRRKLQPNPMGSDHILTEAGVGYRLRTQRSGYAAA